jgi:hypothetical protein
MHVFSAATYLLLVKCTAYTGVIYLVTTYSVVHGLGAVRTRLPGAAVEES